MKIVSPITRTFPYSIHCGQWSLPNSSGVTKEKEKEDSLTHSTLVTISGSFRLLLRDDQQCILPRRSGLILIGLFDFCPDEWSKSWRQFMGWLQLSWDWTRRTWVPRVPRWEYTEKTSRPPSWRTQSGTTRERAQSSCARTQSLSTWKRWVHEERPQWWFVWLVYKESFSVGLLVEMETMRGVRRETLIHNAVSIKSHIAIWFYFVVSSVVFYFH